MWKNCFCFSIFPQQLYSLYNWWEEKWNWFFLFSIDISCKGHLSSMHWSLMGNFKWYTMQPLSLQFDSKRVPRNPLELILTFLFLFFSGHFSSGVSQLNESLVWPRLPRFCPRLEQNWMWKFSEIYLRLGICFKNHETVWILRGGMS